MKKNAKISLGGGGGGGGGGEGSFMYVNGPHCALGLLKTIII